MSNPVKLRCRVGNIIYHSDTLSSVFLVPEKKIPKFLPGQFLHFALDEFDPSDGFWPESRVFSIASAPFETQIRITYSVKGHFTKRMYDEIKVNNYYWIKMPYGHFTINDSENVVLLAGGTGITPFVSFLKSKIENGTDVRFSLFYGIRKRSLFVFEKEICSVKDKLDNTQLFLYCEDEEFSLRDDVLVKKGMIDKDELLSKAKKSDSAIYISGPQGMISYFMTLLINNNIQRERIKLDEWE